MLTLAVEAQSMNTTPEGSKSLADLRPGRNAQSVKLNTFAGGTIGTIERIVSGMPAPKTKKKKKKKAEADEPGDPGSPEGGKAKKKKKKAAKKSTLPENPPMKYGE